MKSKCVINIIGLTLAACSSPTVPHEKITEFKSDFMPIITDFKTPENCSGTKDASIPIFGKEDSYLSFKYLTCHDRHTEILEFKYVKNHLGYGEYIVAKTRQPISKKRLKNKLTIPVPYFGFSVIGENSLAEFLSNHPEFRAVNWDKCEIENISSNVFSLKNPDFVNLPPKKIWPDDYDSFAEWQANWKRVKKEYEQKYGEQAKINKHCANRDLDYLFVVRDGLILIVSKFQGNKAAKIDFTSIQYSVKAGKS